MRRLIVPLASAECVYRTAPIVALILWIRGPERARMLTFPLDVVLTVGNRGPERALSPTFGWNSRIVFVTVRPSHERVRRTAELLQCRALEHRENSTKVIILDVCSSAIVALRECYGRSRALYVERMPLACTML